MYNLITVIVFYELQTNDVLRAFSIPVSTLNKSRFSLPWYIYTRGGCYGCHQHARASGMGRRLIRDPVLPWTIKEEKRQDNLAIIGFDLPIQGTTARSLPALSMQVPWYPSKSSFVMRTASPPESELEHVTGPRLLYSWTACALWDHNENQKSNPEWNYIINHK